MLRTSYQSIFIVLKFYFISDTLRYEGEHLDKIRNSLFFSDRSSSVIEEKIEKIRSNILAHISSRDELNETIESFSYISTVNK